MKKILILAYFYPPRGGSGVQRTLKFVKYLRRFGWDPVVLTVRDRRKNYFVYDDSLLSDHPDEVPVIKTESLEVVLNYFLKIFEPLKLKRGMDILCNALLIPDRQLLWVLPVLIKVGAILKKYRIGLIYTSAPPQSVNLLGVLIKKLYKVKWVADYRDPWTHNAYYSPKCSYRKFLNRKMEALAHRRADIIIANTSGNRKKLIDDFGLSPEKVTVVTNGFDEQDFEGLYPSNFNNAKFNVVYSGTSLPGYSPMGIFRPMRELCVEFHHFKKEAQLHIAGPMERQMEALVYGEIREMGLENNTRCYGYLGHRDCIHLLLKADLLVLILSSGKGTENWIPAKCFEYLRSGKPILALVPGKSECAALLKNHGIRLFAEPDDPDQIKKGLYEAYLMWKENRLHSLDRGRNGHEFKRFRRDILTGRLAEIFNHVFSGNPL